MAIPAYARARIDYLRWLHLLEPKVAIRKSYREGASDRFRVEDSLKGRKLMNEIYRIIDSYNTVPVTPPSVLAARLRQRQKEAIARAIKQVEGEQ